MNPQNVLREVLKIYELGKAEERAAVRSEAYQILSRDLVLASPSFADVTSRLCALLAEKGELATTKEEGGQAINLLRYYVAELQHQIKEGYITNALSVLAVLLSDDTAENGADTTRFDEIYGLTSHLLSTLIDNGFSLEALYTLYARILVPRKPKPGSLFERRLEVASGLLTQPEKKYLVVLSLDNVTAPAGFPQEIGGVVFSSVPNETAIPTDSSTASGVTKKFLQAGNRRLFASMEVTAKDPRMAGSQAADYINDILNLVRFEYERDCIQLSKSFAFSEVGENRPARTFELPAVVPNPSSPIDGDGLAAFVKSVDELVLHGAFDGDGRDRVMSAFRLYRTGLDTPVLENKLMNWWTALEYLVRGSGGTGGIGKSIETMLSPVLSRTYIAKHLHAFRIALIEQGITYTDPSNQEVVLLKGMPISHLYDLFKSNEFKTQVLPALDKQVFMKENFGRFLADLGDPKKLYERNLGHEQRLKWQLQRLWRARCDIVHSANKTVSAALLCANLEYYLKSTLMSLLKDLRDIPTLSGPKEFFDRQACVYQRLQSDLKAGHDSELKRNLAA